MYLLYNVMLISGIQQSDPVIYMCVCVYIYIIHIHICTHIHIYTYVYVHMYTCYIYMCIYTYTYMYMHICAYVHIHCVCVCVCTHIYGASMAAQMVNICLQCSRPGFDPWVRKTPCRRKGQTIPVFLPGQSHG